jgi:ELWxxDGT repeat protein
VVDSGVEINRLDGMYAPTAPRRAAARGPLLPASAALRPLVLTALAAGLLLAAAPPAAAAAPRLVVDLNAGPVPNLGSQFRPLGTLADGRAVFAAGDAVHGLEPWITDGTAAGTRRLADVCPGPCNAVESGIAAGTGSHVVFVAVSDPVAGPGELWSTDGTPAGTRRLVGGLGSVWDAELRADGAGRAYLLTQDDAGAPVLWVTDGTPAGSRRLPHLGLRGTTAAGIFGPVLGGRVVFIAGSGVGGTQEVWTSDGTAAGTVRIVGRAEPGRALTSRFSPAYRFATVGGGEMVIVEPLDTPQDGPHAVVRRSDGTPSGTHRGPVIPDGAAVDVASPGTGWAGVLMQRPDGGIALWRTDGTAAGTALLAEPAAVPSVGFAAAAGGRLFYDVQTSGDEHWRMLTTDGTPAGTGILEPPAGSCAEGCLAVGPPEPFGAGLAFLTLTRHTGALDLWWTDGTPAGSRRLDRVCDAGCTSSTSFGGVFAPRGVDELYLAPVRRGGGWSLVVSDGTPGGSRVVAGPGLPAPFPFRSLLAVDGGVVFPADDGVHGHEPWVTDGTAAGTGLLVDAAPPSGSADASPTGLTRHGEEVLFFARGEAGWGLYASDGTAAGTRRLHELAGSDFLDSSTSAAPVPLAMAGDRFFFLQPAPPDADRADLKVAELDRGVLRHLGRFPFLLGLPPPAAVAGDRLLWVAGDRLGVSDGTVEGSYVLGGRYRPATGQGPLVAFDGTSVLFSGERLDAAGQPAERGVWRTDGTAAGTVPVHLVAADVASPPRLAADDGTGWFALGRRDGETLDGELWLTDGTAAGTGLVARFTDPQPPHAVTGPADLTVFAGRLFFTVHRATHELWITDGTTAGTVPLLERPEPWFVDQRVPLDGGVLFSVFETWTGAEPWWSDGTAEGTRPLGDLWPGHQGSQPRAIVTDGDRAFFAAAGGGNGVELRIWTTDGTAAGTFLLDGTPPPPSLPAPGFPLPRFTAELAIAGGRLLYPAATPESGDELWTLPARGLTPPPPGPPQSLPPAPEALTVGASGDGSVFLRWIDRSNDELYFEVEARTPASGRFEPVHRVTFPNAGVGALTPELPHTFRVRAVNAAGASPPSNEVSAVPTTPDGCATGGGALCLGGRFRAAVHWRNPRTGGHGTGRAMTLPGSDRSGAFWFFDDENVELIVKALDGTPVNRRYWVFTGGLTDVEYWLHVVDTEAAEPGASAPVAERVYHHRPGDLCGFADADAFPGLADSASRVAADAGAAGTALELAGGRFRVEVDWRNPRTGNGGHGVAVPGTDGSGYFWFFDAANLEWVVKVLDGRPVNGYWWVFWGGLTDLDVTLRVTDTQAVGEDAVRTYRKAPGDLCGGADTTAF